MMRAVRAVVGRANRAIGWRISHISRGGSDSGSAIVEFLGVTFLLLLPLVYLVLVLAKIQAATYAVQGAAKDVGRAYVLSDSIAEAETRAGAAFGLALANQGFEVGQGTLSVRCGQTNCLAPGGTISATAAVSVSLPGIPGAVQGVVPIAIPVSATHVTVVDPLRAAP